MALHLAVASTRCGWHGARLPLLAPRFGPVASVFLFSLGILALAGGRRAGWWWLGVASRPRGRNGATAGEHGPGLGRPMTVTLVGVITLMKASSRAVSLSVPNAPGETLDPVPPGLAMATLCVVLPLEGVALELDSAGGTCGFGGGWAPLALLSASSLRGHDARASMGGWIPSSDDG